MDATRAFILDGSVSLVWGFKDENDSYAISILESMSELQAYVPAIRSLEVANALLVGERRGRIDAAGTERFLSLLGSFPISVDAETLAKAWIETIRLARDHRLSAYDAAYLELALRLGLPIATMDGRLKTAALGVGVRPFTPP